MLVILSCGIPGHLVAIEGDKLKQNWTVFYSNFEELFF